MTKLIFVIVLLAVTVTLPACDKVGTNRATVRAALHVDANGCLLKAVCPRADQGGICPASEKTCVAEIQALQGQRIEWVPRNPVRFRILFTPERAGKVGFLPPQSVNIDREAAVGYYKYTVVAKANQGATCAFPDNVCDPRIKIDPYRH